MKSQEYQGILERNVLPNVRKLCLSGRYSPTLEMAFQIARVFGVPLDEVFHYPED